MKRRCDNKKQGKYKYYGGKGIKVCNRWLNSFENFATDVGERPSKKHSLDRIDSGKDYTPGNCRWATHKEQMRNTTRNIFFWMNGERHCLSEWAEILGMKYGYLQHRIEVGMSFKDAVTVPPQPGKRLHPKS